MTTAIKAIARNTEDNEVTVILAHPVLATGIQLVLSAYCRAYRGRYGNGKVTRYEVDDWTMTISLRLPEGNAIEYSPTLFRGTPGCCPLSSVHAVLLSVGVAEYEAVAEVIRAELHAPKDEAQRAAHEFNTNAKN